jgi:hypothetical protein
MVDRVPIVPADARRATPDDLAPPARDERGMLAIADASLILEAHDVFFPLGPKEIMSQSAS